MHDETSDTLTDEFHGESSLDKQQRSQTIKPRRTASDVARSLKNKTGSKRPSPDSGFKPGGVRAGFN